MPYATLEDLPAAVRKLPKKRQRQWKNVFNSALWHCTKEGGDAKECETKAFKQAWSVVGKKEKMTEAEIEKILSEESTMETEKATNAGQVFLQIPITKVDEEQRIVEGVATAEVLDTQGDIVDFPAAVEAFKSWEGNIREQHDPKKAVGRAVEWKPLEEEKAIRLAARISKGAQDTWEKVKDKTLKYFSIASPFGGFERKPETLKGAGEDGSDKTVSRLFLKTLSEVSLVDVGANPLAKIELVKADGMRTDVLAEDEPQAPAPGDDLDKAKKVKAVIGRLKGETKTTVQTVLFPKGEWTEADAKAWLESHDMKTGIDNPENGEYLRARQRDPGDFKKGSFRIIAFGKGAKSIDSEIVKSLGYDEKYFRCVSKQSAEAAKEIPWVPMDDRQESAGGDIQYIPRTFGDVYESVELQEDMPKMIEVLRRCMENILFAGVDNATKRDLMVQCVQEFFEEIDEEMSEEGEAGKSLADSALEKIGARHSKQDLDGIQKIHDHSITLGASCKSAKSATEETSEIIAKIKTDCEAVLAVVEKAASAIGTLGGLEKLAAGPSMEKVAETAKAEAAAVKTELETKLADESAKVAKVAEITSKHEGEIAKANEAIAGATKRQDETDKRLEAVEKQPALPIVKPDPKVLELARGAAAGTDEDSQLAALVKTRDATPDPIAKEALNRQISLIELKQTLRKR
jgi:cation transport regulator ChaB